jgi:integrase
MYSDNKEFSMALIKEPFKLYVRHLKSGDSYSAKFLLPDGTYSSGTALGTRNRRDAERIALAILADGKVPFALGVNFRSFTRGFFEWEGEWASRKRKRRKRISEGHCKRQAGNLENHLLPVLGNLKLEAIDENVIDELIDELDEKGISARTINHSLVTLSHIMQTAMKKGLISMIPPIEKLGIQNIERGIITIQEFIELRSLSWKSKHARIATLIGCLTGLRQGEILGIKLKDIGPDFILLDGTWSTNERRSKETDKTGERGRFAPIPQFLREEIQNLMDTNPWQQPDSFLFYSTTAAKPVEHNLILREYYRALDQIGISVEERKARNIVFHSTRHFFLSLLLNGGMDPALIQKFSGHKTMQMVAHYTHMMIAGQETVRRIQKQLAI